MKKEMYQSRLISRLAENLIAALRNVNDETIIPVLEITRDRYQQEYLTSKQVAKDPSVVYQMFGKKTSDLTPDEFRRYKAFLKRQRDSKKRELNRC